MKTHTPGGIRCPEAYAQGKMLDHSWWHGMMARSITPSDIDMVVESCGCFLFCEISRDKDSLQDMNRGQRMMLQALSKLPGNHCVAVLKHGMFSHSRPINTATDIESVCVYFDCGEKNVVIDGDAWRRFACHFTHDPAGAIRQHLRSAHEAS